MEVFYQLLNRDTSLKTTLDERIEKVRNHYILENGKESVAKIPVTELIAPDSINFKSYKYVILDGIYHATSIFHLADIVPGCLLDGFPFSLTLVRELI